MKTSAIMAAAGFLVLGLSAMGIYVNNQAVANGAVAATDDWANAANWLFASLGGAAGILGMLGQLFPQLSPFIKKIQTTDIGDQVIDSIGPILSNIDSDPTNDKPISFAVTRDLSRFTASVSITLTPKSAAK